MQCVKAPEAVEWTEGPEIRAMAEAPTISVLAEAPGILGFVAVAPGPGEGDAELEDCSKVLGAAEEGVSGGLH